MEGVAWCRQRLGSSRLDPTKSYYIWRNWHKQETLCILYATKLYNGFFKTKNPLYNLRNTFSSCINMRKTILPPSQKFTCTVTYEISFFFWYLGVMSVKFWKEKEKENNLYSRSFSKQCRKHLPQAVVKPNKTTHRCIS